MDIDMILSLRRHDPDQVAGRRNRSHLQCSLSAPHLGLPGDDRGVSLWGREVKDWVVGLTLIGWGERRCALFGQHALDRNWGRYA